METKDPLALLQRAYDPKAFRRDGHALVDRLADYLERTLAREGPVLPWVTPERSTETWTAALSEATDLDALTGAVLERSHHLHHPRYVGHQVAPPVPGAALLDLLTSLLNNSVAIYEMSPVATAMERAVVGYLAEALGMGPGADGVLTSGGSAGNLTGLLAARQARAGFDVWNRGAHAGPRLGLLVSEQAHYSAIRAAQVMGVGREGCASVATDHRYRLDPDALAPALEQARSRGLEVFAVVASAGSTATGAFDPLEELADFCAEQGLWLHVDGAHGAAAALSSRYRHLLAGIERADSVVWDAHKMMAMPSLITAVLFRDGGRSYDAFAQHASYLLGPSSREEWYNHCHRTLECTKNGMAIKLYGALRTLGPELFDAYVTRCFDQARVLARLVDEAPDFELAVPPQANIVCFRHAPAGCPAGELDALQETVRRRILESGRYYLVQTVLRNGRFLRTTLMNPFTSEGDLTELLELIRSEAY
jgi:L-2,4-diaminobutyrate decarboxylase